MASDDLFQFWVTRFNSSGNLDDIAWDLEVDDTGNVYVTGTCDMGGWIDVATLKYDSKRNLLWQRFLNVNVSKLTRSFVELDSDGNVYVSCTEFIEGDSSTPSTLNLVTRKYDSSGNELWEATYGPDVQGEISDLEVDDDGNVYLARKWYGIIKYDTNGTQKWWKNLQLEILDLEVDDDGNIYVTGSGSPWGSGETDIYTSKFNSTGFQLWYDYNGARAQLDIGMALTVDDFGNVYVAGMSWSGDAIIKYNSSGVEEWTARYAGTGWDSANSIAVDEDGNVYVSGSSFNNTSGFYDCLIVKHDCQGSRLWEARYDGPMNKEDLGVGLVLDGDAYVYVTCQSVGVDPPWHDYATIMYDTDGNQLWVARYDGPEHGDDRPQDIEIDADGNVYVTGSSNGTTFDFVTIKYSALTPSNAITSLIYSVEDMELAHGIENSLVSKLENTLKSLNNGRENAAINQLHGLINQVKGLQTKLTDERAFELIGKTQEIITLIQQD